jgi:Zinc carboxypeptidase.
MKRFLLFCLLQAFFAAGIIAQPQPEKYPYDLAYFLPEGNHTYNPQVPTPESVLGFQLGQQHVGWDQVVIYMKELAATSDRVSFRETGRTWERRPFIELVFTSAENHKNLEQIRENHLKLSDIEHSGSLNLDNMPVVTSLVYSIHGNEPSCVNSSIAVAYYLAAAQGSEIDELLKNQIVVMNPGANPDGINRFASWVNSSRSLTDVSDLRSREFSEAWPSSRLNHYWMDCNRDWLMAQHPEGINCINNYFNWLPNVVIDLHEMGDNYQYFFSPGHPKRTHPLTTQLNQQLTAGVSSFTAQMLDGIGTTFYTKEGYDDYYYGKGGAYGDISGAVSLLYEQGSSRGHLRSTANHGVWSFSWTIRNQAYASFASIMAAKEMRPILLNYLKEFYEKSAANARKESVQGYVFDARGSKATAFHFLETMAHHRIDVYRLAKDYQTFSKDDAYIIPVGQKYSTRVKALMENTLEFTDSTFYDISAWTFPHAYNLNYTTVKSTAGLTGSKVTENSFPVGKIIGGKSSVGYVFENTEFYAPKVAYELQRKGIRVTAANRPFLFKSGSTEKQMGYGTYQVLVLNQSLTPDEIHDTLSELAKTTGVDIYSASTGLMPDTDMGSPAWRRLIQPKVAMLVGRTMGVADAGEIWFLLDNRFQMRPVLIENHSFTLKDLLDYTVIILPNGIPTLNASSEAALKDWVASGGTLVATGRAWEWVNRIGLLPIKAESIAARVDSTAYLTYADRAEARSGRIPGVILNYNVDKTHPLVWGLEQDQIPVMKNNNFIFKKDADPYASPLYYTSQPVVSGFLSAHHKESLKDSPAVFAKSYRGGKVIVFADDLNFRSYFFGTSKIFMNALFYGSCI